MSGFISDDDEGLFLGGLPTRFLVGAPGASRWLSATLTSDRDAVDSRLSSCCREVDLASYLMGAFPFSIGVVESNSDSKGVFSAFVFDNEDAALRLSASKSLLVFMAVVGGVLGKLPVILCPDMVLLLHR